MQEIMGDAFFLGYHKGQILFMEGDPRDRIYFLLSGYVKLVSMNDDCSSQFFLYLKPYSIFPYVGLFKDKFYRFSGEAVTDVELIYLPVAKFERLIQNDPVSNVMFNGCFINFASLILTGGTFLTFNIRC